MASPDPTDDAPATAATHAGSEAVPGIDEDHGDTAFARAVTINRSREEVYAYFRDFANLPSFMDNIVRIDVLDERRSHWVVRAPGGTTAEWDAVVTEDEAPALIAWASAEGADVPNSGRVEFADAGARGTVVTASFVYDPPGGVVGRVIAKLFQREPAIQARRDLRRLKQLMETGEVATAARTARALEEERA